MVRNYREKDCRSWICVLVEVGRSNSAAVVFSNARERKIKNIREV